jgi:hypothetical protein
MLAVGHGADGIAEVARQVPAVCHLAETRSVCGWDRIRRALAPAVRIGAGPRRKRFAFRRGRVRRSRRPGAGATTRPKSRPVGQAGGRPPRCAPGRPGRSRSGGPGATPSRRPRGRAEWAAARCRFRPGVSCAAACPRWPASPPSASPKQRCRRPRRSVRRAASGATPGRRSAKVGREQEASRQRKRRAWTRSSAGRPCQGRSPRSRS